MHWLNFFFCKLERALNLDLLAEASMEGLRPLERLKQSFNFKECLQKVIVFVHNDPLRNKKVGSGLPISNKKFLTPSSLSFKKLNDKSVFIYYGLTLLNQSY
jgi:hypothetical protein